MLSPSLYGQTIFATHDAKTAGHFTVKYTLMILCSVFTFFNIYSEVVKYVAYCKACLLKKRGMDKEKSESGCLYQRVHLDIRRPLNPVDNIFWL